MARLITRIPTLLIGRRFYVGRDGSCECRRVFYGLDRHNLHG